MVLPGGTAGRHPGPPARPAPRSSAATRRTGPQSRTAAALLGQRCAGRRNHTGPCVGDARGATSTARTKRAQPRPMQPAPCPPGQGHTALGRPPMMLKPREPESRCRTRLRLLVSSPWREQTRSGFSHGQKTGGRNVASIYEDSRVPQWPPQLWGSRGPRGRADPVLVKVTNMSRHPVAPEGPRMTAGGVPRAPARRHR